MNMTLTLKKDNYVPSEKKGNKVYIQKIDFEIHTQKRVTLKLV